jgi:hypothetical protein
VDLKEMWNRGEKKVGDAVNAEEVNGAIPSDYRTCPGGGTYVYGKIGEAPRCTIHGYLPGSNPNVPRYWVSYGVSCYFTGQTFYVGGPDVVVGLRIVPGYPTTPNVAEESCSRKEIDERDALISGKNKEK